VLALSLVLIPQQPFHWATSARRVRYPNGMPRSFRERYDPSARTLRVNMPCAILVGLATMSGGTAEDGDGDLDG
jgi:hypothetical protein